MASFFCRDLTDNPSFCNPIPNITALSAASFANSALSFPACNASILAAQAASNTSPAPSSSPSASPSASPSPEAISPAASNYHTSPGINVAVSILVGLCFLLGICGGFVRIRQQQRRHRVSWQLWLQSDFALFAHAWSTELMCITGRCLSVRLHVWACLYGCTQALSHRANLCSHACVACACLP